MTWKDGERYGLLYREIISEDGSRVICRVKTYQYVESNTVRTRAWPQGQFDFNLVLQAPKMLEALEEIAALETPRWPSLAEVADIYEQSMKIARAAIAAVKGDSSDDVG